MLRLGHFCLQTPSLLPFPDLTQPELAYPLYPQPEIDPKLIARIDDVYLRNLDMPELIEKARIAVISHAAKLLKQDPGRTIDYIVLDMPCTFFMLRSLRYTLYFISSSFQHQAFCASYMHTSLFMCVPCHTVLLYSRWYPCLILSSILL